MQKKIRRKHFFKVFKGKNHYKKNIFTSTIFIFIGLLHGRYEVKNLQNY